MNQNQNILAKINSNVKIVQYFCIEITNKDQVLKFDSIRYTQFPSCSEFITIDKDELKYYMTTSKDPEVLFNLEQSSKQAKSVDITKMIAWTGNQAC